jgi:hypothetical protein
MIKIKMLEKDELPQLTQLLTNYQGAPYLNKPGIDKEKVSDYAFFYVENFVNIPGNRVIVLMEKNKIGAFCAIKPSEIETTVFGKNFFCIDSLISAGKYQSSLKNKQALLNYFHFHFAKHYDMVSCRSDMDDISGVHALEKNSFLLMDGLVTYTRDMSKFRKDDRRFPYQIRLSEKKDLTKIVEIAKKSFSLDRYHSDCHLPGQKSNLLYGEFVKNASKGIGADRILVAVSDGEVIGFNTIELKNRLLAHVGITVSSFVLNAVASEYRNKGVYSSLIYESMNYLSGQTDEVEIRTHVNNFPVHRALSRLGFNLTRSQVTFHRWNLKTPRRNDS